MLYLWMPLILIEWRVKVEWCWIGVKIHEIQSIPADDRRTDLRCMELHLCRLCLLSLSTPDGTNVRS